VLTQTAVDLTLFTIPVIGGVLLEARIVVDKAKVGRVGFPQSMLFETLAAEHIL